MWGRVKKISLMGVISSSLIINGLYPLAMYVHAGAEVQIPTEELQTIIKQEEQEIKQIETKEQMKVEQERTKLIAAKAALAKALQEADQLIPQLVEQTNEEAQKEDQVTMIQCIEAAQLLNKAKEGHSISKTQLRSLWNKTVLIQQAKEILTAIREANTQIKASPQQIKKLVANEEQQIARVQQEKKQHETEQQQLQNNDLKVDTLKETLEAMVYRIETDCKQITESIDDELNKMLATIRVVANDYNLQQILASLEVNKEKFPRVWRDEWVKAIAPSLQEKQALVKEKIAKVIKERITQQAPAAEQLLHIFQQNSKEQLEQLENQLVAQREKMEQEQVVATQGKLQQAYAREAAAYQQVGRKARTKVEWEELSGQVKLVDLWASQREAGAQRIAAQTRADAQTKDMIEVLKNQARVSFQGLWQALNQTENKQATQKVFPSSVEIKIEQPLYTTAEQATHYALLAIDIGKQLQAIARVVQGEREQKIASESTFGKMFAQFGESFQHPGQLFQSMYEGNKQTIQGVEKELQMSLFGPEEQETDMHIRQQKNKQHVLRTLVYLSQLLEQVDAAIAVTDLLVQAQWITTLKQPFQTETERATYIHNVEAAAAYVLQVKQAQMQVKEQYEVLKQGFSPIVEQIEHNLFDASGWQAQIIDKLKYIQFVFIGIDPIGSFVPIDPELATMVGFKGISREAGIIARVNRKLKLLKKSAVKIEEKTGAGVSGEIEKAQLEKAAPTKEEITEMKGQETGAGTSGERERTEIEKGVPAAPTAEEIVEMKGQQPGAGTSGEREQTEIEKGVPAAPTAEEIAAVNVKEAGANGEREKIQLEKAAPTKEETAEMKGQETGAGTSGERERTEIEKGVPAAPTAEEIAEMKGQQPGAGTSGEREQTEIEKGVPAAPTAEEIAVMKGQQPEAGSSEALVEIPARKFKDTEQQEAEKWIKKQSKKWTKIATPEEYDAIETYSGGYSYIDDDAKDFPEIQAQLRDTKGDARSITMVENVDNLFKKIEPLTEDVIVYRGIRSFHDADLDNPVLQELLKTLNDKLQEKQPFEQEFKQFKDEFTGRVIIDYAYMSTSLNPSVSQAFGGSFFMELRLPKGSRAIAMPLNFENGSELEMLLPRGTEYKIKNISTITYKGKQKIKIIADIQGPFFESVNKESKNKSIFKKIFPFIKRTKRSLEECYDVELDEKIVN